MMKKFKYEMPQISIVDYELDQNVAGDQTVSEIGANISTEGHSVTDISFP